MEDLMKTTIMLIEAEQINIKLQKQLKALQNSEDLEELSECCTAPRHHIFCDLCSDCQEWTEFIVTED